MSSQNHSNEKCTHNWILMHRGDYEESGEYEVYYCSKCLTAITIEYPDGERTIVDISEVKEEHK